MNGFTLAAHLKKMNKYEILEGIWFFLMMTGLLHLMMFL